MPCTTGAQTQRQIAQVMETICGASFQTISGREIESAGAFRFKRRDRLRSFDDLQFEFRSIEFQIALFQAKRWGQWCRARSRLLRVIELS